MANEQQILDRIKDICAEVLKVDKEKITKETKFKEDLGADSMDTALLLMALENEFKSSISDEEAKGLCCVNDVISLIKNLQPAIS
jgi:acyl carrier protein